ncbi:MAG TPA: outer membrane lipoprotein-sorting protein [Candidatus Udaeobacter sp.]
MMTKPSLHSRHPERSRRIPWNYFKALATGFLNFARNDRNSIRYACFVICFAVTPLSVFAEPPPSAKDILDSVRMVESRQQIDLQGQLRQEDTVVPFRLMQNGPLIRYTFTDPDETLELRLGENSSRLELVNDSGTEKVGASKLQEKIHGTIVLYGDLAFKFLYWPTARVVGEENVRTRKCWKLQLRAPSHDSPYSNVLLWVDKASGALMRMEGYDWDAKLIKRFEVVSAQKIEGRWFLKQMRVEQFQPGTNHVEARAYLEIKR